METPEKFKPFEAQLLSCPFCGSPAVLHWSEKQTWVWPHCSVCEAAIDDWFKPADAVAAWNKRTTEAALAVAEARAQRLQTEQVELRALLTECSTALDYMEDRGYSSIRYLRSKVRAALSAALVAPGGTE